MNTSENRTITFSIPAEVAQKVRALARFEEGNRTTWFLKLFALHIAYSLYMDERSARITDRIFREAQAQKPPLSEPEEENRPGREEVKKHVEEGRRKWREEKRRMTPKEKEALKREEREMEEIDKMIHDGRKADRIIQEAIKNKTVKRFLNRFTEDFLAIEKTCPVDRAGLGGD